MWRGAMIERFARLEATALQCLFAIKGDAGETLSGSCVAWDRFPILDACLDEPRFAARSAKLKILLKKIGDRREFRTGLAHGTIKSSSAGLVLT